MILSVLVYETLKLITKVCSKCAILKNSNGHVRQYSPDLVNYKFQKCRFRVLKEKKVYDSTFSAVIKRYNKLLFLRKHYLRTMLFWQRNNFE